VEKKIEEIIILLVLITIILILSKLMKSLVKLFKNKFLKIEFNPKIN
jgi:hypothetical protein